VVVVDARDDRVGLGQLTETPTQRDLAVGVQVVLAGEEEHLVLGERGADGADLVVRGGGEVDAGDADAEAGTEALEVELRVRVQVGVQQGVRRGRGGGEQGHARAPVGWAGAGTRGLDGVRPDSARSRTGAGRRVAAQSAQSRPTS
jgi:hypothetical protein